jgi:DNA-directed RNA polymerase subunit RPC12/RpoP
MKTVTEDRVKCPYCSANLFIVGSTAKFLPIFSCVNCGLYPSTLASLKKQAEARRYAMLGQSSRFKCNRCGDMFPTFKFLRHVLILEKGQRLLRLMCPDCEERTEWEEADSKIKEFEKGRTNISEQEYTNWLKQNYVALLKNKIQERLKLERKIK